MTTLDVPFPCSFDVVRTVLDGGSIEDLEIIQIELSWKIHIQTFHLSQDLGDLHVLVASEVKH